MPESKFNELCLAARPLRTAEMAEYPYSAALEDRFTVTTRFGDVVELFKRLDDRILLPRAIAPVGLVDDRELGESIVLESKVVPKSEEQARVIAASKSLLLAGESHILEAATGVGKTVISCDLIASVKKKTLVIVTKQDLMTRWYEELLKCTSLTKDDVGFIQQDKLQVKGRSVCIGLVHSLCIENRYPEWLTREFGLVVWDECHRVSAETFVRTASMFPSKLRFGLSATPKRSDGKEIIFQSHIGEVRVRSTKADLTPKVFYWVSKWKAPRRVKERIGDHVVMELVPHAPDKMGHIVNHLVKSVERNKKIAELVKLGWTRKRRIVVFSDRIQHLNVLRALAVKEGVPFNDMAMYVGGMKENELKQASKAPVIFASYPMMSEGTDIPELDMVILTTPRANVKQVIGRVLRICEGKNQPAVFDLVDQDSPVLARFWTARFKFYEDIGAQVQRIV